MCVIVHQPKGTHLTKTDAEKLWKHNPQGGGFAFINQHEQIEVFKSMAFADFWTSFKKANETHRDTDFLLHMRIATHGSVSLENVHPFAVDDNTMMAHNGIINEVTPYMRKDDDRTDSQYFAQEVLPTLREDWLDNEYALSMVEKWIGWSKLLFVTTNTKLNRNFYRLGKWEKHKGMFLSNLNGLVERKSYYGSEGHWETIGANSNVKRWVSIAKTDGVVGGGKNSKTDATVSTIFDNTKETSEDWDEWARYQMTLSGTTGVEDEVKETAELIDEIRKQSYIKHDFVLIDAGTLEFECNGCLYPIDDDGDCMCWDMVCGTCWNYIALCDGTTEGGSVKKHTPQDQQYLWKTLTEKGQAYVGRHLSPEIKDELIQIMADKTAKEGASNIRVK